MKNKELRKRWARPLASFISVLLLTMFIQGCASSQPEFASEPPEVQRYHSPLMSPGTQFAELPPAVQRTIRAEVGTAVILDVVKELHNDQVVYEIVFENAAVFPPLYVAPDGSVLKPSDLTIAIPAPHEVVPPKTNGPIERVTLQDLPPQVVKTIQGAAPDSEIDLIEREKQDDKVVYRVSFKDRSHPILYLAPDGTLLRESRR